MSSLQEHSTSLPSAFNFLFYLSRFLGIIPHSLTEYYYRKKIKTSQIGILWVIKSIILIFGLYHYLMTLTAFSKDATADVENKETALTHIIGIVLNYLGPSIMSIDLLFWLLNQQKIVNLFDEFKILDMNLKKENIIVDNTRIRLRSVILIVITIICEFSIMIYTYNLLNSITYLWVLSSIPTIFSALDKIWFSSFLYAIKQRLSGLNLYIDKTVDDYIKLKTIHENGEKNNYNNNDKKLGYLQREILNSKNIIQNFNRNFVNDYHHQMNNRIVAVIPWEDTVTHNDFKIRKTVKLTILQSKQNILNDVPSLEEKLDNLCKLHDEMCELGKTLNVMWNIQLLMLMAYGFMSITAQFYFLYCSITKQPVPSLFRSSKSLKLSLLFVAYVASKCVYVIFLSWQTKVESRRTGVCLHKCAIALDDNNFYEIANHISLKLMNHCVDFSACGFFNLDMTTLYGVTGAITSYLIILIQFNLATINYGKNTTTVTPGDKSTYSMTTMTSGDQFSYSLSTSPTV